MMKQDSLPHSSDTINEQILLEAADWMMQLQEREITRDDPCFLQWRAQSNAHAQAWQRAEAIMGDFNSLPVALGKNTFQRLQTSTTNRRTAIKTLALALALPCVWVASRNLPQDRELLASWTADYRTAHGEQKTLTLADGSQLVLNSNSAVDIRFTARERRVYLHAGEILITTAKDPSPIHRPFGVTTPQGRIQALGTRFSVRRHEAATQVAVFEAAVRILPTDAQPLQLDAGQQVQFELDRYGTVQLVDKTAALWQQGMFVARDITLAELASELNRHSSRLIRVHPAVADMRVSGAFPLNDLHTSLNLLAQTLPVRIGGFQPLWISINAAPQ